MAVKYSKEDIRRFREVCDSHLLFASDEQLVLEMKARGWSVRAEPLPPLANKPGILAIDRSSPFDIAKFDKRLAGYSVWRGPLNGNGLSGKEEQDERSLALTQIDISKIHLVSCLKGAETIINGKEWLARLKSMLDIRLDPKVFQAFLDNQAFVPKNWNVGRIIHIFFQGMIFRRPDGKACSLFMARDIKNNAEWFGNHRGFALGMGRCYFTAVYRP